MDGRKTKMVSSTQIKEVYFERVFNLGNYETMRLGLHATVAANQTAQEVVQALDAFTVKMRKNRDIKEKG
jgi:proteasome assembly chaperone (PAC2) family protein